MPDCLGMKTVKCPACRGKTKRNGKTKAGAQRCRCVECGASTTQRYSREAKMLEWFLPSCFPRGRSRTGRGGTNTKGSGKPGGGSKGSAGRERCSPSSTRAWPKADEEMESRGKTSIQKRVIPSEQTSRRHTFWSISQAASDNLPR